MALQSKKNGKAFAISVVLIIAAAVVFALWQQAKWRGDKSPAAGDSATGEAAGPMAIYRRLCEGKELAEKGQYAEALPVFEEIAHGASSPSYKWDAEIQAADAIAHLGRHSEALARLDRIIKECPLDEEAVNAQLVKGQAVALAGKPEEALVLLEKLVADHTDRWSSFCEEALVEKAAIYHRLGRPGLVRATFARIIADYPGPEGLRRSWAEKQTKGLTEAQRKSQEPRIAESLANKRLSPITHLNPGTTSLAAGNGPYLITGQLRVDNGQVLQIEAGTELRFGVLGQLSVEGRLEVLGAQDRPVLMLPLGDDPAKDWWSGLEVSQRGPSQNPCRLSHCRVLGAAIGLEVRAGSVEMDNCTVDRCQEVSVVAGRGSRLMMTSCQVVGGYRIGVEAQSGSRLQMDACRVVNVITHGISLQEVAEGSRIRQCRIENCGRTAMLSRGRCAPSVENCEIQGSRDNGIDAIEGASPVILSTRLEKNGGIGIHIRERSEAVIRGSSVVGNGKTGILGEARCAGEIVGNRVEANGDGGACLRLGCTTKVEQNQFIRNKGVGLLLQNSQPASVQGNQFSENSEAALRNEGPNAIQADSNWWGSANEADIARVVQDRQDNPAWGEVQFRPWLSEPPANTKPAKSPAN
jgi:tetratricopeptide (TPR) repeat protein